MSDQKGDSSIKLGYDNWYSWDRYITSTIRRKNAYIAFEPEPIDPRAAQNQVVPATTTATTATPSVTVTPVPSADDIKTYRDELKEWKVANNVAAGVILGTLSDEVQYIINPKESAKSMYDKLQAEIVKQSSGSSANGTRLEIVYKQFKDAPTMENFEKHLTFYRSKNASLNAAGAGIDDSWLAWLLLNSFNANQDPVWLMASTNIVTSDTPINQWSFNHVAGKLREALRNNTRPAGTSTSGENQTALNVTTSKTNSNRYSGSPCTHPTCQRRKSHATEDCWTKEREEKDKKEQNKGKEKKHKAKKAKKKDIESSSDSGTESSSESDSASTRKKRHHANRSQMKSERTLRVLKATVDGVRSCIGKTTSTDVFIAHPDSGASNHMTHKFELFDPTSFKTLSKPIAISLGDDSEIFATGRGSIRLMFNIDGDKKEGRFNDVLYVPDLKVTLLSVGQSARLPHCKVVFDDNICEYIDKNTNKVIARAYASNNTDLYTLDATPITQKVAANLTSTSSRSINVNVLHRRLGHLGIDNCHVMINRRLVDGVDRIVGEEEFCEGCAYGRSK